MQAPGDPRALGGQRALGTRGAELTEFEGPAAGSRAQSHANVLWRALFWSPVGICLVLLSQVCFLGLRPAVCQNRRLGEAESLLEARHARDVALRDAVAESLRARGDPVFRERQRRLRVLGPPPNER